MAFAFVERGPPEGLEVRPHGGRGGCDLLPADRVVHQTDQGDGVAKKLQEGDGGVPDEHGDGDEEDVLQDPCKRHDQARGLANLYSRVSSGLLEVPPPRTRREQAALAGIPCAVCYTYQEHAAHVQQESNRGVQNQDRKARLLEIGKVEAPRFVGGGHEEVHDGADGGVVVETD